MITAVFFKIEMNIMLEIIESGGWLMIPLFACSIIAIAIIAERFWSLQTKRIAPPVLMTQIWQW
jgi:biopolymer transport protein ExbB